MTLSELRRMLDTIAKGHKRDDPEIVIRTATGGLGGGRTVPVRTAAVGGDWYAGLVLLYPDEDLVVREDGDGR